MEWPCPDFIGRINISPNTYTTLYLNPVKLALLHQQMVTECLSLLLPPFIAVCWASPEYIYMLFKTGLHVICLAQPQEQGNRQTNASQPHQPGPVASRQPPRNPPQRQASAPPTRQQNSQPAERSSGQPTQRSPERASPRQQGVRSAEGRSPRSQSSRTARESSARPDQQSQEISAVRESQPPGDDVSSSSSLRQLNQQRRAMHTPQRPSSKESTCAQHASAHKRAVEVPAPAHSAKRRKDPSPPHPSPRKTASSRTTRQQTGIPRRRDSSPRRRDGSPGRRDSSPKRSDGSPRRRDSSPRRRNGSPRRGDRTEATRETSGTSFVVVADVHVGTTDRQNNHKGQGDGQRRQCPVESGRQTGSTGNTISRCYLQFLRGL